MRAYYAANQAKLRAQAKAKYAEKNHSWWVWNIAVKYGVTEAQYLAMLAEQSGACKVCGVPFAGQPRRPAIDHCHTSGKVRGLLCTRCNTSLGAAHDDPDLLRALAAYVEAHK